jgi:hypothetical protein
MSSLRRPKDTGYHRRPLMQKDIETAQANTASGLEAARYLDVGYATYKKYAKLYGLFDKHKNAHGVGIPKMRTKGKFGLESILNGEHPFYDRTKLKERLIKASYLPEECVLCGFKEKRIADNRCPLILHNKDGNPHNFHRENIELRCYNCTYLSSGKIYLRDLVGAPTFNADLIESGKVTMDEIEAIQDELMDEA